MSGAISRPAAIEVRELTKRFGTIRALDRLSFRVPAGTVFGFLGPNGAGKTTTIRILAGLSAATGGDAAVAGMPVTLNSRPLQSRIGYLPDRPAFYGWMTAREAMVFSGEMFGLGRREAESRSKELLELAGLAGAANRRVGGYSRGMRQRLGLAQALVNRPSVLMLDEPASALDPIGRVEVLELLRRLKEQETTVFMSSHLLDDVERVCDEVAIIDRGRLVVQAPIADLRQRYSTPVLELDFETEVPGMAERLRALSSVAGVESISGGGRVLRAVLTDVAAGRDQVLRAVGEHAGSLRRYELVQPSLEEVFVRLVGGNRNGNGKETS